MKICPKCKSTHEKPGIFCSQICANSRKFSKETKLKKSEAAFRVWNNLSEEEREQKGKLLHQSSPRSKNKHLQTILSDEWEFLGIDAKRLRVILDQNGKCNKCSLFEWQGQPITLEYEHKDGNHHNNSRDNVECLCPNCHSQTSTWRGRKKGMRQQKVIEYLQMANS